MPGWRGRAGLIEAEAADNAPDTVRAGGVALDPARLPATCSPTASRCRPSASVAARSGAAYEFPADGAVVDVFLGIDIGSVSTNLVVLDQAGEVVKAIYTKTQARPVEVVGAGLTEIRDEIGDRIRCSVWAPPARAASSSASSAAPT